jgi:molecular chaperone GrpE (heat shock protein)
MKELENHITVILQTVNNLRHDVEKKENEKHDQLIEIAKGIIETLDSFDKVDEWLIEKGFDKSDDSVKTKNRYNSVKIRLLSILQKYGITRIEFPENRIIVGLCEVVETEVDNSRQNDELVSIVKNGYIRGKELIRAAQIIVIKN